MTDRAETSTFNLDNSNDPNGPLTTITPPPRTSPDQRFVVVRLVSPYTSFTIASIFEIWSGAIDIDQYPPIIGISIRRWKDAQNKINIQIFDFNGLMVHIVYDQTASPPVDIIAISENISINFELVPAASPTLIVNLTYKRRLSGPFPTSYRFRFESPFTGEDVVLLSFVTAQLFRELQKTYQSVNLVPEEDIIEIKIIPTIPTIDSIIDSIGDIPTQIITFSMVPEVKITAQTDIAGLNLSDVLFEVVDKVQYANGYPSCNSTIKPDKNRVNKRRNCNCQQEIIPDRCAIQTLFSEYPDINKVLRGQGCFMFEKLRNLQERYEPQTPLDTFVENVLLYGLSRYILSRLLYGFFDIQSMLRSRTNQFFIDLAHSRYCHFISRYTPIKQYERYFLRELKN